MLRTFIVTIDDSLIGSEDDITELEEYWDAKEIENKPQGEQISVEDRLPDDRNTAPVIVNWHETSPEPWMGKEQA